MTRRVSTADLIITLAFMALAVAVLLQAREWPFRGALFPMAAGWVMLAAASLHVLLMFTSGRRGDEAETQPDDAVMPEPEDVFAAASRSEWAASLGWMSAFFLLLWVLGASVAIPAFATAYLLVASRESPVVAIGYAFVCWLFVYGLFDRVLHIPLPRGVLLTFGF